MDNLTTPISQEQLASNNWLDYTRPSPLSKDATIKDYETMLESGFTFIYRNDEAHVCFMASKDAHQGPDVFLMLVDIAGVSCEMIIKGGFQKVMSAFPLDYRLFRVMSLDDVDAIDAYMSKQEGAAVDNLHLPAPLANALQQGAAMMLDEMAALQGKKRNRTND